MRRKPAFRPEARDAALESRQVPSTLSLGLPAAQVGAASVGASAARVFRIAGSSRILLGTAPGAPVTINLVASNVVLQNIGTFNAAGTITTNGTVTPGSLATQGTIVLSNAKGKITLALAGPYFNPIAMGTTAPLAFTVQSATGAYANVVARGLAGGSASLIQHNILGLKGAQPARGYPGSIGITFLT